MKIISVVGARPNFMKVAPFIEAIQQHDSSGTGETVEHLLVHTGQHYDDRMSDLFFEELGIPRPDLNLNVGSGKHVAMEEAKHDLGDTITYCESDMEAVQGADALALITKWTEFRVPDWDKVAEAMNGKVLFDGRNLYRRETLAEIGFDYYGIGS